MRSLQGSPERQSPRQIKEGAQQQVASFSHPQSLRQTREDNPALVPIVAKYPCIPYNVSRAQSPQTNTMPQLHQERLCKQRGRKCHSGTNPDKDSYFSVENLLIRRKLRCHFGLLSPALAANVDESCSQPEPPARLRPREEGRHDEGARYRQVAALDLAVRLDNICFFKKTAHRSNGERTRVLISTRKSHVCLEILWAAANCFPTPNPNPILQTAKSVSRVSGGSEPDKHATGGFDSGRTCRIAKKQAVCTDGQRSINPDTSTDAAENTYYPGCFTAAATTTKLQLQLKVEQLFDNATPIRLLRLL